MNNSKVADLLNKGFKFDTLKMLNETQIETLHNTVVEQNNLKDRIQGAKEELAGVDQMVNNIAAKLGEQDDEDLDDSVEKESGYDPYAGNSVGNDDGPSANDGFNNASDGMDEGEVTEKFRSKAQQG